MAINRVDFGGNTLIDLTGDTLESAEQLMKGIIAHAKDGSVITGLLEAGGGGGGGVCASGTFTLSSGAYYYEVTHNLGVTPNFAVFFQGANYAVNGGTSFAGLYVNGMSFVYSKQPNSHVFPAYSDNQIDTTSPTSMPSTCYGVSAYAATPTTIKFGNENKKAYGFRSGAPIFWIVGVIE